MTYAKSKTDVGIGKISLGAEIVDSGIWFRERIGSAELDDGTKVEIALSVGGAALLVTITPPGTGNGWRTYVVSPRELCAAVLRAEGIAEPSSQGVTPSVTP